MSAAGPEAGPASPAVRVLMVVAQFWPIVGGAETQARRLAAELSRQGAEVELWTGRWSRDVPAEETISAVRVRRLGPGLRLQPVRLRRYLFSLALLWRLLREGRRFDVVHVHQLLYPAFVAALAGVLVGRPVLARISSTGSTSDLDRSAAGGLGFQRAVTRRLLTRVVAVNRQALAECLEHGYRSDQVELVPNGVPLPQGRSRPPSGSRARFLYVGGLRAEKRVELILAAWDAAGRPGPLVIAGDGPERARLERAARGFGPDVRLVGEVTDPQALYAEADVFVLASDAEGMSNALLEAMAAGCACVATAIGGNVDALDPDGQPMPAVGEFHRGRAGLLVRRGDGPALTRALNALAADATLRRELGEAAQAQCEATFSIASVARRSLDLYAELRSR